MVYIVGLVECFQATHTWLYQDYPDAVHQLRILCEAYQDVKEVCPVLLKVGQYEVQNGFSLDTLLKQYSFIPNKSQHE